MTDTVLHYIGGKATKAHPAALWMFIIQLWPEKSEVVMGTADV